MELISVHKALEIILENSENTGLEEVDFQNSIGRVLKETIIADRDFPPFNRVSMDGIAIDSESFNKGDRTFKIEGVQAAGSPQLSLQHRNNCLEVMTGAMLPNNTDSVIPYEMLHIENGFATINIQTLKKGQNIHTKGLDRKKGTVLIEENSLISPAEIGVLATVGKSKVLVVKQPKVVIISTGNELVEVSDIPKQHQIRRSNVYNLAASLERLKIRTETHHIPDDKEQLKSAIAELLETYDVLLFSGAVSKGKFDFIPEVLQDLGVEKLFHKVKQRPGKPFWFGKKLTKTVFAFPGNPVSTFISCLKYFYPWYQKSVGLNFKNYTKAILTKDFSFKPNLTYFLQVKLSHSEGKLFATPVAGKGSGDLTNLVDADGFLEIPSDSTNFTKGAIFPILEYRSFEF